MKAKSANGQLNAGGAAAGAALSEAEKLNWLRLVRTPNIGPVTFWELLAHFKTASAALDALPSFANRGSRVTLGSIPSLSQAEAEAAKAHAAGMRLTAAIEPSYPPLLAKIETPPPLVYMKGDPSFWRHPAIAVVGSRQASAAGLKFAARISGELSQEGFRIVSGLARGIDAAAHRAALTWGTAAVLPGGLDAIYPPEHVKLAEEITASGVLIGECPPGFAARAQDFPRRNRIVSGCCFGVVVVEAAERSGSLITARLAGEQNREVFAVPGHPFDSHAAGTLGLIKQGAILTASAEDVIDVIRPLLREWGEPAAQAPASRDQHASSPLAEAGAGQPSEPAERCGAAHALEERNESGPTVSPALDLDSLDEAGAAILKVLSVAPVDLDDLVRVTGMEVRQVSAGLLALDLSGRIDRRGHRLVALKP